MLADKLMKLAIPVNKLAKSGQLYIYVCVYQITP